jgi:hypothetical protein
MNFANRDLLVLSNKITLSPQRLEQEVRSLHELLYSVENTSNFCTANEVINLNTYRIIHKPHLIEKAIKDMETKPFIFLNNKN